MTLEDFSKYLEAAGGFRRLSPDPVKPYRIAVSAAMAPHYYGEIPASLKSAFPNETGPIMDYRIDNYRPRTKTKILAAIGEIYRLFSASKYSIDVSARLADYLDALRLDGVPVYDYFFKILYPLRVIDPNAILLLKPDGAGLVSEAVAVEVSAVVVTSDRVLNDWRRDGFLIYSPEAGTPSEVLGHVVTSDFYGDILRDGSSEMVSETYRHGLGSLPFFALGGRSVSRFLGGRSYTVYESDFSHALPYLDDLAVIGNQAESVLLSACFPIKLVTGVNCDPCNGRGVVPDAEGLDFVKCKKCHGSGRSFFPASPLAGYYIAPPPDGATSEERREALSVSPIRYEGPPVDSVIVLNEQKAKAEAAADNALNIQKAVLFAQSGRAKEMDRERDYISIGRIAADWFSKLGRLLEILQGLRFLDTSDPVVINPPRSFDIKTETGLLSEFLESLKDTPPGLRFSAYMDFVKRRFSGDELAQKLAALAAKYSPLYLATMEEREALLLSRAVTRGDVIKAVFVFPVLQSIAAEGLDLSAEADVFAEIDRRLSERISPPSPSPEPPPVPNLIT
jgi:hypothetical protein